MTARVFLFGTQGCHLCEEAEAMAATLERSNFAVDIEIIDIAEQEQWLEKYAIRIPVVYHPESQAELFWPFDIEEFKRFISELKK